MPIEIEAIESRLATTTGSCAVMGTASTMACIAEALGMTLQGTAAIPAVHADRDRGDRKPAGYHDGVLRRHGHRLDHGLHCRSAGHDLAGHGRDPCRACRSRSRRSKAGWLPRRGLAPSWAPPRPWPALPKRWA